MEKLLTEANRVKSLEARKQIQSTKIKLKIPRPLKAIRMKCLDCVAGSISEVAKCHLEECGLWPYRFGRNPRPDDLLVPEYDRHGEKMGEHLYGSQNN